LATAGAGPVVPLVFGDLRRQRGQLRDLMPGRLGVVRPRVGRQRFVAAVAVGGDKKIAFCPNEDQVDNGAAPAPPGRPSVAGAPEGAPT
jgi:hypothetical protein